MSTPKRHYFTVTADQELLLLASAQKAGLLAGDPEKMTQQDREHTVHNVVTALIVQKCEELKQAYSRG